jgi:hypothetical protein
MADVKEIIKKYLEEQRLRCIREKRRAFYLGGLAGVGSVFAWEVLIGWFK